MTKIVSMKTGETHFDSDTATDEEIGHYRLGCVAFLHHSYRRLKAAEAVAAKAREEYFKNEAALWDSERRKVKGDHDAIAETISSVHKSVEWIDGFEDQTTLKGKS